MTMRINVLILPQKFITPIISAVSVIAGSLIGAVCSWITTKHATIQSIEMENKIVDDNRKYDEIEKKNKLCENINIIRLDICTAIFQSIRILKDIDNKSYKNRYPIPVSKDYSKIISSITSKFDLKELSYIYQLYAIIENLSNHIKELGYNDEKSYEIIKIDCKLLLKKLYGINYLKALDFNIDNIRYEKLYNNEIIKEGYKNVLRKLDESSYIEECQGIFEK